MNLPNNYNIHTCDSYVGVPHPRNLKIHVQKDMFLCDDALYIVRQRLSITRSLFRYVFRVHISSEEQAVCNNLLPFSFFGLLNISECHLVILLNFYGVLYTPTPIKSVTA